MATLIVGTGFLGEALCDELRKRGEIVIPTHHTKKKYADSLPYDFFYDDPKVVFAGKHIDTVIIPAKIEFAEDSAALGRAMERLLAFFSTARIVYISSDGIFDGKQGRYTEVDIPRPVTLYGRNLTLCEDLIRKHAENFCVIRPSYMYGFVNGVLDERLRSAKEALEEDEAIARFTDMYKSPLSYMQAARIVATIAHSPFIGTVHISGERTSVYNFTKEGMMAIGIPTEKLIANVMPVPVPDGMLADTSLDNGLMIKLTGITPMDIRESLSL